MKSGIAITATLATAIAGFAMRPAPVEAGSNFAAELLLHHNIERKRLGRQPLSWSRKLALDAKRWADRLASADRLEHANTGERDGAGENLWMGSAGYYSAGQMISGFIDERRHYLPGTFPHISSTGNWRDVGHYTQIIWGETREVGCAVAKGRTNDFLVCRYWPAGNTYGKEV